MLIEGALSFTTADGEQKPRVVLVRVTYCGTLQSPLVCHEICLQLGIDLAARFPGGND